jgi:hypothetical protein
MRRYFFLKAIKQDISTNYLTDARKINHINLCKCTVGQVQEKVVGWNHRQVSNICHSNKQSA